MYSSAVKWVQQQTRSLGTLLIGTATFCVRLCNYGKKRTRPLMTWTTANNLSNICFSKLLSYSCLSLQLSHHPCGQSGSVSLRRCRVPKHVVRPSIAAEHQSWPERNSKDSSGCTWDNDQSMIYIYIYTQSDTQAWVERISHTQWHTIHFLNLHFWLPPRSWSKPW